MNLSKTILHENEIVFYGDVMKEVFIYSFSNFRSFLYGAILDANKVILNILGTPINKNTPLWMITGGEAINLYTLDSDRTPTKDLDVKLILMDKYNIPESFLLDKPEEIKSLKGFIKKNFSNIFTEQGFKQDADMRTLDTYLNETIYPALKKYFAPHPDYELGYFLSIASRSEILWNTLNYLNTDTGSLMHVTGNPGQFNISLSLRFTDLDSYMDTLETSQAPWYISDLPVIDKTTRQQVVVAGKPKTIKTEYQLFICKTPFITTGLPEQMYPYYIPFNDNGIYEVERGFEEHMEIVLNQFYTNPDRVKIWNLYYKMVTLMNIRRNLMAMATMCVLVKKDKSKICIWEGMLDLFLDFSAGTGAKGKKIYENKSLDGMIPNILKTIDYCGRQSFIRIPTLNWLIYDQNRMLYHSLRQSDIGFRDWTENGVAAWKDGNIGKHPKYFKKLKGLLKTYSSIIDHVETLFNDSATRQLMITQLRSCTDEENCTPSDFLSYVYDSFLPYTFISREDEAIICPKLLPLTPYAFVSSSELPHRNSIKSITSNSVKSRGKKMKTRGKRKLRGKKKTKRRD